MMQCVINGALLGGIYALIGIGMSLLFGMMKLTNLAHGDLMILANYLTIVFARILGLQLIEAVIASAVVMAVLGFVLQYFLINSALDKGAEPAMLVMFGVSIILSNLLLHFFGADNQIIKNRLSGRNIYSSKLISISGMYTVSFFIAIFLIAGLALLMKKTNFGRAFRAISDDVMAAELMGVNTRMVYAAAMMLAMVVSTIAGTLVGCSFVFFPFSGKQYLILAFGVVAIGGMGSLMGTMVGGVVLGLTQLVGGYLFGSSFQMAVAYLVLLIILAVRPNGIFAASAASR